MSKIGVFDSGIGGLSVARSIKQAFADDSILYASDTEHMPYGDKTPDQVLQFVLPILNQLVQEGCAVIVIACNTVTTTLIKELRQQLPVPLIGIEPMVKPAAALTKRGVIAVCATPATLASKRYAWLKQTYATGVRVIEPDCRDWAYMIEHNQLNEGHIRKQITELCNQGADVIVLGCTHYHWIEEIIANTAAQHALVLQPEQPVVARLKRVLGRS